jgi:hypothetical protein
MEFTPDDDFNKEVKQFEQWLAQDQQPAQEEVIQELEGWLAQDQQPTQHIDMSDEDLWLLTPAELIARIEERDEHIGFLMDRIQWHEDFLDCIDRMEGRTPEDDEPHNEEESGDE